MLKKLGLIAIFSLFISLSFAATSCLKAKPTNDPLFCASFKSVAKCHCVEFGLPSGMCEDMNQLYWRIVAMYGSLEQACKRQHETSAQDCMDNWHCFRDGGMDSQGRICSSNYSSCPV
ncbi:hypothetical protein BN59_01452 [Legionella massiliensis]|uniref:Lipoprotein n=1 Tax=Legionella massiliensis TaxID=1034943 RepID=A0A078KRU7_9GAMM|nr:hypothetical protein [Legionella massiliensis]CDZ77170.1 hypothetical protein BN59_01452 [Legionella massiliensis]CEE12908.1 hypothetical protein BN1094_01452 [Legionella massiliensis]